ncbi:uncharacterized protein LOC119996302 isoform X2 [Tripterygium wilfordii]|uniref:uncharacterized protein LOC119996302 isoform X2 n=1 Tax=Tripterygium wilfordii TaxID=458696 RepID=UPI0018F7F90F|nr:uncharacterized protein LOC119996302 isoform X2 [Tripterygium wilfordii]
MCFIFVVQSPLIVHFQSTKMKFLLSNRCALSSSRPGLDRIKSGRNWVCKRSPRKNMVRERSKRLLNTRQSRVVLNGKKIKEGIARLKLEMAEISAEQKSIAEGQKHVRKKCEEMQREREQLHKETELISLQSMGIRIRLNLMFQILKARVESDSAKVAQLTRSLRDLIANPKEEHKGSVDESG